jgi:catechol 2,3-dioxygenase-like lactoylglutathione lyase family enzyme
MLDHIFLTVSDLPKSIAFFEEVLRNVGITIRHDYDGKDAPPGHPDLKRFGAQGRMFFWLRQGSPSPGAVHVGFAAHSKAEVDAAHAAALADGRRKSTRPDCRRTTILVITPLRYAIPKATVSNSYSRAGSTLGKRLLIAIAGHEGAYIKKHGVLALSAVGYDGP